MGYFRFQRRIGIGSFGRINISKGGVSLGIGARGSWLTVGKRGCARRLAHPAPGCRGPNRGRVSVLLGCHDGLAILVEHGRAPRHGVVVGQPVHVIANLAPMRPPARSVIGRGLLNPDARNLFAITDAGRQAPGADVKQRERWFKVEAISAAHARDLVSAARTTDRHACALSAQHGGSQFGGDGALAQAGGIQQAGRDGLSELGPIFRSQPVRAIPAPANPFAGKKSPSRRGDPGRWRDAPLLSYRRRFQPSWREEWIDWFAFGTYIRHGLDSRRGERDRSARATRVSRFPVNGDGTPPRSMDRGGRRAQNQTGARFMRGPNCRNRSSQQRPEYREHDARRG